MPKTNCWWILVASEGEEVSAGGLGEEDGSLKIHYILISSKKSISVIMKKLRKNSQVTGKEDWKTHLLHFLNEQFIITFFENWKNFKDLFEIFSFHSYLLICTISSLFFQ